jgi:glutamyl-tRNA reductase
VVTAFHDGFTEAVEVLAQQCAMTPEELSKHLYVHYAAKGVEHLFSMAAGLDSKVLGEAQILGQLRTAYTGAEQAGTVGRTLHGLAQQALRVGKRVRTETGIDAASASVLSEVLSAAATALAGPPASGLAGPRVMLLGAGSLGSLAAAHLRGAGVAEIVLGNRTLEKAQRLAALGERDGIATRVISLDAVRTAIPAVDLLICCTAATRSLITTEDLGDGRRPLVVYDLGLPRNVEAGVVDRPGVTLLDLPAVARRQQHRGTPAAVQAAQHLVAQEVQDYLLAQRSAEVIPTIAALRKWAAEVVDSAVRAELTRTVRRVIDKLLHAPTVRVQELAKAHIPAAVTTPRRGHFRVPQTGRTTHAGL